MAIRKIINRIKYKLALRKCDRFFQETNRQKDLFDKINLYLDENKEYTQTYRPAERTHKTKALVKEIITVFGAKYIIIALISGSIGYHSYRSAELVIKALFTDGCYTSERNCAVFKGDLVRELFHDLLHIRREKDLSNDSWSKPQLVKLFYNVDRMKNWSTLEQMGFSCMYPTGI